MTKRPRPQSRPWKADPKGWDLLRKSEEKDPEEREGRTFKVVKLPDAAPPTRRSHKTRYHYGDVGKEGNINK